jgi:hypothetical protein
VFYFQKKTFCFFDLFLLLFERYGEKLPFSLYRLYKTFWLSVPSSLKTFIKMRKQQRNSCFHQIDSNPQNNQIVCDRFSLLKDFGKEKAF